MLSATANAEGLAMSWTDERVETLKKLWGDGLSASQIAAELGGITRNAVIGKVHRLGLSGRAKSPSSAAPRPRKARAHSHMLRVARPAMRGNTALAHAYDYEVEAEPELVDNVIPIGQRRTLLELTEVTCHWPIGDPGSADFFFCGGQSVTNLPYCAYHSRIAYQPANVRRDRRPPFRG
jgi:GcrA cell cycle regulator